jgi:UDP-N-acetylmuramoylalanine--D-glutamate ligase
MKVAIAGYGVEGRVSYQYWKSLGDDVTIVDESENVQNIPASAKAVLGKNALSHLSEFDLIVRTPPLRPDKIHTQGKVWSATNEFFARCIAPIIGVTGTKGKGTTSSLIAAILKATGKTVHLVGNIGVPALEELPKIKEDHYVVFELSSFQLWDLQKSPEASVVLMIETDHMDVHNSMEEYVAAKANITNHQSTNDLLVYHPTNEFSCQIAAASPAGIKKRYMSEEGASVQGDVIVIDGQRICQISEVGLIGAHNLENICAAITASWRYTQDVSAIKQAVTNFTGLPHRLEFVREVNGIKFYDDSYSTNPAATIAAIKSFTEPLNLILGGYDRGLEVTELVEAINNQDTIKNVFIIGASKERMASALKESGSKRFQILNENDFSAIVKHVFKASESGDIVLLSPGFPSFDMFKNFTDRGEQFKMIVRGL